MTLDWNPVHLPNAESWFCKSWCLLVMWICEMVLLDLSTCSYFSDRVSMYNLRWPRSQGTPSWSFWDSTCMPPCLTYSSEPMPLTQRFNTVQSLTSNFRSPVLILFLSNTIPSKYFQDKCNRRSESCDLLSAEEAESSRHT